MQIKDGDAGGREGGRKWGGEGRKVRANGEGGEGEGRKEQGEEGREKEERQSLYPHFLHQ